MNPSVAEIPEIPDMLIAKVVWPLVIRNTEAQMYRDVEGLFGVPELYYSYNPQGPDGREHLTKHYIPEDATYWDVFCFGGDTGGFKPEERVLAHHFFKTDARDLLDASSPYELVEGIMHSMIGVYVISYLASVVPHFYDKRLFELF